MQIRGAPNVIRHSIRVNVEADSLNAAVLGPDVEPRSDMYELFLKDVVRDMTQKAGQKCTAIRRVLVPQEWYTSVKQDLAELLGQIRVGDPRFEDTRMGPLASGAQLADVRAGVGRLGGRHAFGSLTPPVSKGFFLSPILVEEPGESVHEREVFGPVASLLRYKDNPAEIVARGNGGLVCSVYSDDQDFIERMVAELAPYHGRLFLGHPKIELSPGPGTVLPQLVHGGPGRAGGGEELGGLRGLSFYLQRTALEGSRPVIQKLLGKP
jgi:oxepin-CoA hydrolase/3-oxo-5,6-dehydrosuberyl-CoA semialdehyde dehydrogenase